MLMKMKSSYDGAKFICGMNKSQKTGELTPRFCSSPAEESNFVFQQIAHFIEIRVSEYRPFRGNDQGICSFQCIVLIIGIFIKYNIFAISLIIK